MTCGSSAARRGDVTCTYHVLDKSPSRSAVFLFFMRACLIECVDFCKPRGTLHWEPLHKVFSRCSRFVGHPKKICSDLTAFDIRH